MSTGSYYSAYAYVIYRTVTGDLSWGSLQFLAGSIAGASANIQSIFATFSNIADQSLFLTDLVEFFRVKPTLADGARTPCRRRGRSATASCSRTCRSITRATRARSSTTSTSASRRGERVALVGENGQGKTTLVKLITRLYDPTAGRVLLDGVDLREYDIEDLHREIGVIFQDFVRYEMTARREHRRRPPAGRRRRMAHPQGGRPQPGARRDLAAAAAGTTSCSAAASMAASISRAASGRRSRSPVPTCATRSC